MHKQHNQVICEVICEPCLSLHTINHLLIALLFSHHHLLLIPELLPHLPLACTQRLNVALSARSVVRHVGGGGGRSRGREREGEEGLIRFGVGRGKGEDSRRGHPFGRPPQGPFFDYNRDDKAIPNSGGCRALVEVSTTRGIRREGEKEGAKRKRRAKWERLFMFLFAKMATIFALRESRYGQSTKQALANTANHHLLLPYAFQGKAKKLISEISFICLHIKNFFFVDSLSQTKL